MKDGIEQVFMAESRSAISGRWEKTLPTGRFENGKMAACSMWPSQRAVYAIKDTPLFIMSQPPGAGKSTAVKFCHIEDVISNPKRRLVISVPLEGIWKTFGEITLIFDDKSERNWSPRVNLCTPTNGESKLKILLDFLTRKNFTNDYGERICVCTHDLLEAAHKRLRKKSKAERRDLFSNLTVVLDEGHHAMDTDSAVCKISNLLGNFIDFLVENRKKIKNSKVWLTTATYLRGDLLDILSKKNLAFFKRYSLPLDKHWRENFKHIRYYSYGFVTYPSVEGPFDAIEKILRKKKEPTIIYMPRRNSSQAKWCSNGCKMLYMKKVKNSIRKVWPKANVLDLVDEKGRGDKKQKILMVENELKKVDIVLTIDMMNEGIDWPEAVWILDLAPSESLRVAIQRFGRLLRDVPGKTHIQYVSFMQSSLDQTLDPEGYRYQLNEAHSAITSSLLIEEMIQPVNVIPKVAGRKPDYNDESKFVNWFVEEVQDENERMRILVDIEKELLNRRGKAEEKGESCLGSKVAKNVIHHILCRAKVGHVDEVARQIVAMLRRRILPYGKGMGWAVDAGFDELYDDSILDNLLGIIAKKCGVKTFAKYRKISKGCRSDAIWDASIQYIMDFKAKHNGQLPPKNSHAMMVLTRGMRKKDVILLAKRDGKYDQVG